MDKRRTIFFLRAALAHAHADDICSCAAKMARESNALYLKKKMVKDFFEKKVQIIIPNVSEMDAGALCGHRNIYFLKALIKAFPGQIATFPGTLTDKFGGRKPKTATRNTLEISEF